VTTCVENARSRTYSLQQWTFLALFVLAAYAFWRTLEPIWVPVLLGLVIAVGVHPIHERLLRRLGGKHPGLTAAVLTGVVMVLASRSRRSSCSSSDSACSSSPDSWPRATRRRRRGLLARPQRPALAARGPPEEINQRIAEAARDLAAFLGKGATSIVTGCSRAIFIFIFTAITSYYLLREGTEGMYWLVEMMPLPNGQVAQIVRDVRDVTRAMLFSTAVMSVYQGVPRVSATDLRGRQPPRLGVTDRHRLHPARGRDRLVWRRSGS